MIYKDGKEISDVFKGSKQIYSIIKDENIIYEKPVELDLNGKMHSIEISGYNHYYNKISIYNYDYKDNIYNHIDINAGAKYYNFYNGAYDKYFNSYISKTTKHGDNSETSTKCDTLDLLNNTNFYEIMHSYFGLFKSYFYHRYNYDSIFSAPLVYIPGPPRRLYIDFNNAYITDISTGESNTFRYGDGYNTFNYNDYTFYNASENGFNKFYILSSPYLDKSSLKVPFKYTLAYKDGYTISNLQGSYKTNNYYLNISTISNTNFQIYGPSSLIAPNNLNNAFYNCNISNKVFSKFSFDKCTDWTNAFYNSNVIGIVNWNINSNIYLNGCNFDDIQLSLNNLPNDKVKFDINYANSVNIISIKGKNDNILFKHGYIEKIIPTAYYRGNTNTIPRLNILRSGNYNYILVKNGTTIDVSRDKSSHRFQTNGYIHFYNFNNLSETPNIIESQDRSVQQHCVYHIGNNFVNYANLANIENAGCLNSLTIDISHNINNKMFYIIYTNASVFNNIKEIKFSDNYRTKIRMYDIYVSLMNNDMFIYGGYIGGTNLIVNNKLDKIYIKEDYSKENFNYFTNDFLGFSTTYNYFLYNSSDLYTYFKTQAELKNISPFNTLFNTDTYSFKIRLSTYSESGINRFYYELLNNNNAVINSAGSKQLFNKEYRFRMPYNSSISTLPYIELRKL